MKNRNVAIFMMLMLLASCTPFSQPVTLTPTFTDAPTQTASLTQTITLTATKTLTPTPVPPILVFEEDFVSDPLGWKSRFNNPYADLQFSYGSDGLDFWNKGDYPYPASKVPANLIAVDGDFDLEVVFDRRVRLSGLWFSNGSISLQSSDNWFFILIEQGHALDNWQHEKAHLGTYQPSSEHGGYFEEGTHTLAGEFDDFIARENGEIHLRLSFRGNRLNAATNGSPVLTDVNEMYAGKKYFMGFLIGAQDHFIVENLQVWIANKENFQIVNAADVAWKEGAPTFDSLLTLTPILQTDTPTPSAVTSSAPLTIDDFVGTWFLTRHRYYGGEWQNPGAETTIEIAKEGKTILLEHRVRCNGNYWCGNPPGIFSTVFDGNPIVLLEDHEWEIAKLIISLEGNVLHIISFNHFTDSSGRPDFIYEYYYRK